MMKSPRRPRRMVETTLELIGKLQNSNEHDAEAIQVARLAAGNLRQAANQLDDIALQIKQFQELGIAAYQTSFDEKDEIPILFTDFAE